MSSQTRGFTLLEVLVALSILAIALAAGMSALAHLTDAAVDDKQRLLAGWWAQNRLNERLARREWLPLGVTEGEASMAEQHFFYREAISGTPNPDFRRLEIQVGPPSDPGYSYMTVIGYVRRGS